MNWRWWRRPRVVRCYCGIKFDPVVDHHLCRTPGQIEGDARPRPVEDNGVLVPGPVCIGGWLYSAVGGMVFPTNRQCEGCELCLDRKTK